MATPKMERRSIASKLEFRASGDGAGKLSGYAASFNTLSQDLGGFREKIAPGTFSKAIREKHDCRCLMNHDPNAILGRTKSGTLKLRQDNTGLWFDCDLPNTSAAQNLRVSVARGDIDQCSFSFQVEPDGDTWDEVPDPEDSSKKITVRTLRNVSLFDVSAVTYPAYDKGTSVSARSKPNYGVVIAPPRRVELVSPEERQEIQDQFRRDRQAKVADAVGSDYHNEVEEWRTSTGSLSPLEKFIRETKEREGK